MEGKPKMNGEVKSKQKAQSVQKDRNGEEPWLHRLKKGQRQYYDFSGGLAVSRALKHTHTYTERGIGSNFSL